MRKRHHLVVGAVGIFLLVGSIVMSTAGVSGATPSHGGGGHHQEHDRDRDRGHHDKCKKGHRSYTERGGKHDKKKCKPKPTTTTTTVVETTTTVEETTTTIPEETTTVPEETTTVPEETTTVPEETTTVPEEQPEVEGITTIAPELQPQVMGITETPEVQADELAFTGASSGTLAAAGAGLLLLGVALVSGVAQRRRED